MAGNAPRPGYVGEDAKVDRASLKFRSAAAAATYDKLYACLKRDGGAVVAYPLRQIGNFVNVQWCQGPGAEINCAGGDTRQGVGVAWADLQVLHYPQQWPQVFGLAFQVAAVPQEDGLGVMFHWSQGGKGILGDGMTLSFRNVLGARVAATARVSLSDEFELGLEPIVVRAAGDQVQLYDRLRKSPESLRAEFEGRLDALERAVQTSLDADEPRKCVYGEYAGDGTPPPCIEKVPLTDSEKDDARKKLAERLRPERALVAEHYRKMHARFLEVLPDSCWSPASEQP